MKRGLCFLALALWAGGCGKGEGEKAAGAPAAADTGVLAALQTEVFTPRCAALEGCHAGSSPAGGLDLSAGRSHANLLGIKSSRRPDRVRVAPGDPDASYLVQRVSAGGDTPQMPVGAGPLSGADVERLRGWVKEGAPK